MKDWSLHTYLWANKLPVDEDERYQILEYSEKYEANQDKLQVFFPEQNKITQSDKKFQALPNQWTNVALIALR